MQGDSYIHYCTECLEHIRDLKNTLRITWYEAKTLTGQPCKKCTSDKDYFSAVVFFIQILEYTFVLTALHREIKDWFDLDSVPHKTASQLYLEEDRGLVGNTPITKSDLKSLKIFEAINYLKDFVNSKDLDFSLNI